MYKLLLKSNCLYYIWKKKNEEYVNDPKKKKISWYFEEFLKDFKNICDSLMTIKKPILD